MPKMILTTGLLLILSSVNPAAAAEVTVNATLNNYQGNGAYLAIYLTDANGKFNQTLWIAGEKQKYYKHLREWAKGSGMQAMEYDGLTGASVSSGDSITFKTNIDDTLIDVGYLIRIDSAVEDQRDNRIDAEVALTRQGANVPVKGRGYIKTLSYSL